MVDRVEVDAFSHLPSTDLIRNELRTHREEVVPLTNVLTEFSIIDRSHAEELGRSMSQDRGQLSPIVVRAREEDGQIVYDVIDGFHRAEGRRANGMEDIRATVVYGCSDEEMYDLRILAASSVQSVQFPRIAEWITRSYQSTQWAESGLPVHQAFAAAVNDSSYARGKDVKDEQMEELKQWVNEKCKKWGRNPAYVYNVLRTISEADPELVREVRSPSGGGRDRIGLITPVRLTTVTELFPGTEYFGVQRAIMKFVTEKRLSAEQVKSLAQNLGPRVRRGMSEADALDKIHMFYDAGGSHTQPNGPTTLIKNGVKNLNAEPSQEIKKSEPSSGSPTTMEPEKTVEIQRRDSARPLNEGSYLERMRDLEGQIKELQAVILRLNQSEGATNGNPHHEWWNATPGLSQSERLVLEAAFGNFEDLNDISDNLTGGMRQLVQMFNSAISKRRNFLLQTQSNRAN